jgi:predicted MFS family arabinose efflux permease
MRLWTGQTISEFGSGLGALPLLAILFLDATPAQMGLLETMRAAPVVFLGLFAGVWIDRARRRPFLIVADLGRALLLGLVVLAAFTEQLNIIYLFVAAFLVGSLTIFFNIAYQAYVPALVERKQLVEANSKLGITASLAEIASPGLGGLLVQLITAPLTLLLDAVSYLASAVVIATIRTAEPKSDLQEGPRRPGQIWQDILEGLRIVVTHPLLRPIARTTALWSFFGGFFAALYGLFVLREIGLTPVGLGILIGSGGIGALFGAMFSNRIINRLGIGRAIVFGGFISGLFILLAPLAFGPVAFAFSLLLVGQLFGDTALAIFMIGSLSLRQAITPDRLLGRVNASFEFLVGGVLTVGILVGGLIGEWLGLRPALAIAAVGILIAMSWLFLSPLWQVVEPAGWEVG